MARTGPPRVPARPTMHDVARLVGVSAMTVSRTLADDARVAEATRARIHDAIAELGYVPDRGAGSLASRRSGFIAAVLPTLTNSNFADTAVGLTEVIRPAQYELLVGYTMYSQASEEQVTRSLLARRPEALILVGDQHTEGTRRLLLDAGVPVVQLWADPARAIQHGVGFSNTEVGRVAARHLAALGHRRIAAIGPRDDSEARDHRGEERLAGFAAELRDAGLAEALVLRVGDVPFSYAEGAAAMARLLDEAPDIEAVFVISDLGAVGALMECQRRGVAVPGQVSVMGFGNFEIGRQCVPSLTTVAIDAAELGRRAGRLLLGLLAPGARQDGIPAAPAEPAPPQRVDIGFAVIPRASTAPARRGR